MKISKYFSKSLNYKTINKIFNRGFSAKGIQHTPIAIIGAGTGGISVASQLVRKGVIKGEGITIFDPSKVHYYQPGFTKIAGGVIQDQKTIDNYVEYDIKEITQPYHFENKAIKKIDPENNTLEAADGSIYKYDNLIVAPGIQLKWNSIPGILNCIYN
jgi:NADH dehydrogenase FAD-containing subunit